MLTGAGTANIGGNQITPSAPVAGGRRGIMSGGMMAIAPFFILAGEQVAVWIIGGIVSGFVAYYVARLLMRRKPKAKRLRRTRSKKLALASTTAPAALGFRARRNRP